MPTTENHLSIAAERVSAATGGRTCPKCSYQRQPTDTAPAWQCPRCGVVYDKVATSAAAAKRAAERAEEEAQVAQAQASGRPWGWVLLALAVAVSSWWGYSRWRAAHPTAAQREAMAQAQSRQGEIAAAQAEQAIEAELKKAEEHLNMARTEQALEILNRHVQAGNPSAMVALGAVYRSGYRVPADLPKAMELFERAAKEGYGPAFVNLGFASETGQGRPQSYDEAINQYSKAARQGDMTGLYCLGVIHAKGVPGFPPNPLLGYTLLELANRAYTKDPAGVTHAPGRKSPFWASSELRELATKMSPADVVKAQEWADAWRPGQPFPG